MVEVTNELIYEVLKKVQADVSHIKLRVDDHDEQFIAIREQLHGLNGEMLRQDRHSATLAHRLERIETRLNLNDA